MHHRDWRRLLRHSGFHLRILSRWLHRYVSSFRYYRQRLCFDSMTTSAPPAFLIVVLFHCVVDRRHRDVHNFHLDVIVTLLLQRVRARALRVRHNGERFHISRGARHTLQVPRLPMFIPRVRALVHPQTVVHDERVGACLIPRLHTCVQLYGSHHVVRQTCQPATEDEPVHFRNPRPWRFLGDVHVAGAAIRKPNPLIHAHLHRLRKPVRRHVHKIFSVKYLPSTHGREPFLHLLVHEPLGHSVLRADEIIVLTARGDALARWNLSHAQRF
mmetsp:Transcript_5216/g.20291  ORF Transcript_5216/g.20291 Transcript_5216/m.20291 type:complete len:271 (-) Transcript_5216:328-1140(-)